MIGDALKNSANSAAEEEMVVVVVVYADDVRVLVRSRRDGLRVKTALLARFVEPGAGHLSPKYMDVRDTLKPFSFLGLRFRRGEAGAAHIWISKQKRAAAWRKMRSTAREEFADGVVDAPRARNYLDSWVASHELAEVCANSFWVDAVDELELAGRTAQRVQQRRRR